MKISSQLANNFDYCSAEISFFKLSPLRVLSASAVNYQEAFPRAKSFDARM
jgi:hypothetical protein